jgi:sec-independent protein translocase protein TatC
MGFFEHLEELRSRLIKCLWVFMIGFAGCYTVADYILGFLRRPLFAVLPADQQKLYFTSLFENFMTHLKIAGVASLFIFSPFFFYQLWAFVAPGLYPRERKLVIPFVSAATIFFAGGAAFAYFILFPVGFKFFVTYGAPSDVPLLTIDSYYTTCLKLLLLFGLAFELPVLITLFGYLGLVDSTMLRQQRRVAIVVIAVISALFAPPDAISMLILGAPLVLMYEGSIWVVHWIGLKRKERLAAEAAQAAAAAGTAVSPLSGESKP